MRKNERWAWITLLLTGGFCQFIGFPGDVKIGNPILGVNIVLTILFLAGIIFSSPAIKRIKQKMI